MAEYVGYDKTKIGPREIHENSCIERLCGVRYSLEGVESWGPTLTVGFRPFWKRYCPEHRVIGKEQ